MTGHIVTHAKTLQTGKSPNANRPFATRLAPAQKI
jgi:hypothetical protein